MMTMNWKFRYTRMKVIKITTVVILWNINININKYVVVVTLVLFIFADYYLLFQGLFVIGFWPETIFNELRNGSQTVRYGGQAYTPAGEPNSPSMGNGNYQDGNPHITCHMRQVMYGVDIDQEVQPDESLVQTHRSRCYCEGKENNARDGYWDYNFLFGGAGNCTDSPITCM